MHGAQGRHLLTQAFQACGAVGCHLQEQLPFLHRHIGVHAQQLQGRYEAIQWRPHFMIQQRQHLGFELGDFFDGPQLEVDTYFRQQFLGVEGLCDVVVGSGFIAAQALRDHGLG